MRELAQLKAMLVENQPRQMELAVPVTPLTGRSDYGLLGAYLGPVELEQTFPRSPSADAHAHTHIHLKPETGYTLPTSAESAISEYRFPSKNTRTKGFREPTTFGLSSSPISVDLHEFRSLSSASSRSQSSGSNGTVKLRSHTSTPPPPTAVPSRTRPPQIQRGESLPPASTVLLDPHVDVFSASFETLSFMPRESCRLGRVQLGQNVVGRTDLCMLSVPASFDASLWGLR